MKSLELIKQLRRNSWVSLEHFAVNLSGGQPKCIDYYAVLKWKNLTKLHMLAAKHKINTYNEKLFHSDDCVSIWSWPPVKFMTSRGTQEYS